MAPSISSKQNLADKKDVKSSSFLPWQKLYSDNCQILYTIYFQFLNLNYIDVQSKQIFIVLLPFKSFINKNGSNNWYENFSKIGKAIVARPCEQQYIQICVGMLLATNNSCIY